MLKLIFGCYTIDGVLRKTVAICVQDIVMTWIGYVWA